MLTKKYLLKRLESLENELGLAHTLGTDGYHEHNVKDYGFISKINKAVDKLDKSKRNR